MNNVGGFIICKKYEKFIVNDIFKGIVIGVISSLIASEIVYAITESFVWNFLLLCGFGCVYLWGYLYSFLRLGR